ncbi:haloacid dehalogenase-like hydrolase [Bifidobacterium thermacidophilum]|uniref:Haloacid dehalogenase-like hydrolase n=1 Tax=Bifidobacterium thermacidophilum TaxID=246618 RepID=A0ABW8KN97_9BIFI
MANIIALVWDFDKTLIDGYMQDPIFEDFDVDPHDFWAEVNGAPEKIRQEKGGNIRVNPDTYFLNVFIKESRKGGRFPGLNNEKLREYGKKQKFYPGVLEFFKETKNMFTSDSAYSQWGIQVENYIVSTGFAEVIRGSAIMPYVDDVWGCEVLDEVGDDDELELSETVYTIDNTSKTRALFEINKGIGQIDSIDVNSQIPREARRVQFQNMIYIADGPSDIPAFSVVNQNGGSTFAIYPHGDEKALKQVEEMRASGRIQMFAEADYSEGTTANLWIRNKIKERADAIRTRENDRIAASASGVPHHLV